MKSESNILNLNENENILKNQEGQTFVEFVLLLMMIMFLSFSFMKGINGGIGKYWTSMANTLMKDIPDAKKLKLR
jgi:Flp pilus assembly pilin Flp